MKNKLFLIVFSVVMAVSFCTLAGCSDEVQDVSVQYDSPASVSGLTAKLIDSDTLISLTWNAVDNAGGYRFYSQEDGKKTIYQVYPWQVGVEGQVFDTDNDTFVDGAAGDAGKVQMVVEIDDYSASKKYRFGVITTPAFQNNNTQSSGVVWTEYIAIP